MLTPVEVQGKTFRSGIGYDKKDVDAFFREVFRNYEQLYKENVELTDKLNVLSEGIQYYKTIEKTLQKALVLAERTSEETRSAAHHKAKKIETEAEAKAKLIVADAKIEFDQLQIKTMNLIQQYDLYKAQFKQLINTQMDLINSESFQIEFAKIDAFQTGTIKLDEIINECKKQEALHEQFSELDPKNMEKIVRKLNDTSKSEVQEDISATNVIIKDEEKQESEQEEDRIEETTPVGETYMQEDEELLHNLLATKSDRRSKKEGTVKTQRALQESKDLQQSTEFLQEESLERKKSQENLIQQEEDLECLENKGELRKEITSKIEVNLEDIPKLEKLDTKQKVRNMEKSTSIKGKKKKSFWDVIMMGDELEEDDEDERRTEEKTHSETMFEFLNSDDKE